MMTEAQPLPAHLAEIVANYNAATLPAQLMAKPALYWPEFWQCLLGIPDSTANEIVRQPDAPPFFMIGRRRYIRTADAIAWVERISKSHPYYPRVNNKGAAA